VPAPAATRREESGTYVEERSEGLKVEVIGEDLNEDLHEVLLRDLIAAVDHLLGDARQHGLMKKASQSTALEAGCSKSSGDGPVPPCR
jgi:hypothetical protein